MDHKWFNHSFTHFMGPFPFLLMLPQRKITDISFENKLTVFQSLKVVSFHNT
jgi:hypothetical protein